MIVSGLARVGANDMPLEVEVVDAIPRMALGKAPRIRHLPADVAPAGAH